jgi:hypothetical protein
MKRYLIGYAKQPPWAGYRYSFYLLFWLVQIAQQQGNGKLFKWCRKLPHEQMEPRPEARLDVLGRRFIVSWGKLNSED